MGAFVGGCATCTPIDLSSAQLAARAASGALWMQLLAMDRAGFFVAASVAGVSTRRDGRCDNGLVTEHSYSVLRVVETTGAAGAPLRLIQLRNPWAEGEWNGRCSDGDAAFWTREMQHKLNYHLKTGPEYSRRANDDGVFFMLFEDFVRAFAALHVTSWFKDVSLGTGMTCRRSPCVVTIMLALLHECCSVLQPAFSALSIIFVRLFNSTLLARHFESQRFAGTAPRWPVAHVHTG